jgi:RNA polymerase sigma factor (sigma-70 family)
MTQSIDTLFDLDQELQAVWRLWRAGIGPGSPELSDRIAGVNRAMAGYAERLLSPAGAACAAVEREEIVQRWWVVMLMKGFDRYDPARGPIVRYAKTVLRHACVDHFRREYVRRMSEIPVDHPSHSATPESVAEVLEQRAVVRKGLRKLSPLVRKAAILRYWLQVPSAEAAIRCNTNVNTFNSRVLAARRKLKEWLSENDDCDKAEVTI